ncbi:MAG: hypothetical protein QM619_09645 [Micropruina sp.]|uniref:hypothetical protein n=1 Tax=Micropruina sp. TaxID=2737536 RepID=UPI0039E30EF5
MMVTLMSASGAPGVTTTAVALGVRWPRPVIVVEADPKGGSGILAGYFRGQVDHPGLIELVVAQRADVVAEALPRLLLPVPGTQASVLVGTRSHEQAAGLASLWPSLVEALSDVDGAAATDVIVDAGRLGAYGWPQPLADSSDVCLLVMGSDLPSLAANRSWAASLAAEESPGHLVRVLLVGPGVPYGAGEVRRALGVPVLAGIDRDPVLARVFSQGDEVPVPPWWRGGARAATAAFAGSGYVRSVEAAIEAIRSLAVEQAPARLPDMAATGGRRSR